MDARANFWAVANALAVCHVGKMLASSASSAGACTVPKRGGGGPPAALFARVLASGPALASSAVRVFQATQHDDSTAHRPLRHPRRGM